MGIADQLRDAMVRDGLDREEAVARIWCVDRQGLLLRSTDGLRDYQRLYARPDEEWPGGGEQPIGLREVTSPTRHRHPHACSPPATEWTRSPRWANDGTSRHASVATGSAPGPGAPASAMLAARELEDVIVEARACGPGSHGRRQRHGAEDLGPHRCRSRTPRPILSREVRRRVRPSGPRRTLRLRRDLLPDLGARCRPPVPRRSPPPTVSPARARPRDSVFRRFRPTRRTVLPNSRGSLPDVRR
ncbi:malic enzyme-like NAD(P)-binding protein [Streptomyces sp. NPDC001817]|uniref:malic enzyme-like NAD(P)-binding protein n=1 Tax=Streptomyces sp. NPDC001817 TaxID=3154398 RepID=UPI00331CA2ED